MVFVNYRNMDYLYLPANQKYTEDENCISMRSALCCW